MQLWLAIFALWAAPGSIRDIEGWRVHVAPTLAGELETRTLGLLGERLREIARNVPEPALSRLREVPIWMGNGNARGPRGEYHPSADWLRRNGYDPAKAGGVEFDNAGFFTTAPQPMMVMHELAHAYHHQVLGRDNARIREAFRRAAASGSYEKVMRNNGREVRAYALTNEGEYFAELSEAFFGTNDFFPFVHEELRRHDPFMHDLLHELWGVPREP